ncbi:MAG: family 1 glycosylhydrolase [Gemmatimonadaceae bacterium]|nr:family 1 glycosylhydrolase [Gemmatimonadaceae bacterium]
MARRTSFLDAIHHAGGLNGTTSTATPPADASGTPLTGGEQGHFMFATGIECSYPTIDHGRTRRDQMAECGHYARWREDLGLVRDMGISVLRYGLPYHLVHVAPDRFDWSFADEVMEEIRRLRITPILDLMHFGVPDWVGNLQNPELPVHFTAYAEAVAQRYPWVRFYTPVNEMYVTARLSALDGLWNEQLRSDHAFVTAMKHLAAASILASHRLLRAQPDCVIVQSESAEHTHDLRAQPSSGVALRNRLGFLALDLLYGHPPDAEVFVYLLDNGLSREEYDWFMEGESPGFQILGIDYYGRNERMLLPDNTVLYAEDVFGWHQIARAYYWRYRKPLMHTETNHFDATAAPAWLWKQWANIIAMRDFGIPVLGFTWYSLIDQIDWDIALAERRNRVNPCGLFDLDRQPRAVAHAYRVLLREFAGLQSTPHREFAALVGGSVRP